MLNRVKIIHLAMIVLLVILFVTDLTNQALGGTLLDKAKGKVEIQNQTQKGEQPTIVPQTIFIQDFELDHENLKPDQGVLNRLGSRPRVLPQLRQKNDPEQTASNLVNLMSESLQKSFGKIPEPQRRELTR